MLQNLKGRFSNVGQQPQQQGSPGLMDKFRSVLQKQSQQPQPQPQESSGFKMPTLFSKKTPSSSGSGDSRFKRILSEGVSDLKYFLYAIIFFTPILFGLLWFAGVFEKPKKKKETTEKKTKKKKTVKKK